MSEPTLFEAMTIDELRAELVELRDLLIVERKNSAELQRRLYDSYSPAVRKLLDSLNPATAPPIGER